MKTITFSIGISRIDSNYYDRPDDCKHYPVTIDQMVKDECEMLEMRDLAKPKQAQKPLDRLMANSRPSVEQKG